MGSVAVAFSLPELLEQYGCRIVSDHRADCSPCGGRRTIAFTEAVYFCHRCGFKGNRITLAKQLGLTRRLSPSEYRAQVERWRRGKEKAQELLLRVRARREQLYEAHRTLLHIRDGARMRLVATPEDEPAWSALGFVYREVPGVRAELLILEDGPTQEIVAFLDAGESERRDRIDRVIGQAGIVNYDGKFVELGDPV